MSEVTSIPQAVGRRESLATEQLLPLVYDELRRIARTKLAQESPGQTLTATALVHEAYLRLLGKDGQAQWNSRAHFFAAAAEAMRRILVEQARRKKRLKRGGDALRLGLDEIALPAESSPDEVLAVHAALDQLAQQDPQAAELVKLRYFAGFSITEAARIVGISRSSAYQHWTFARAWLRCRVLDESRQTADSAG